MPTKTIAQTDNFIILDKYTKINQETKGYQTEADLEQEFIGDLIRQGYEYRTDLGSPTKLLANVREQLQKLNNVQFTDAEWQRFVVEYLDKPSDSIKEKTRKIQDNHIYDFVFDNGRIQNIYLLDKKNITNNKLQVINQFEQTGIHKNRYDVTILINGLPLVQIELKKRGVAIREAFNQVHRYSNESFNSDHSLFKYVQIFVISNGTDTRYFANTTKRDKNSFDFTINWARVDNSLIKDLKDFTTTFFQKNTLLKIIIEFSVYDVNDDLLLMRPYQIAATERILWKINSSYLNKNRLNKKSGGYIWHTTGSGKTLTSFKAARLAAQLPFIDKVFFVVDRKDLDYQTMKEYQRFSPDSVNGSNNTAALKANLEKQDNKIIVTTIQKLNNLMKNQDDLPIYQQKVVFIFDECHRSQFGEAQKNLNRKFKNFCQFGFTGTPIFAENSVDSTTTASVFGEELHCYTITDAIRDEKVLKFKVDYNDVRPQFRAIEQEKQLQKLSTFENTKAFLHPDRIKEITQYIIENFKHKTHRLNPTGKGFNAIFAVSSVEAAKRYYQAFKQQQQIAEKPLKVATIFSFSANEEQNAIGDINDETFDATEMEKSSKEFLNNAINDYNHYFNANFSIEKFQEYYRDLAKRMKNQEIDLLIVVGMFLTGFDAPQLNTLFVDKNLRYHGLLQAYSRTNRIFNATKTFGNIVTFRDLEQATIDAITLFGKTANTNTTKIVLEKSYQEYMEGYEDSITGEICRGYLAVVKELQQKFPNPSNITTEIDKKDFVNLFGEYLRIDNVLKNYDEYIQLKKQAENTANNQLQEQPAPYGTSDFLDERKIQDYRSTYNDIREWLHKQKIGEQDNQRDKQLTINWDDVVFEVDLLKSQEINLDYILKLIFERHKKQPNKANLIEDVGRTIRASVNNLAKQGLITAFIEQTDLNQFKHKEDLIEAFFKYAQEELQKEAKALIEEYKLEDEKAKLYINQSLKKEDASEYGTALNEILPKISPLNPKYLTLKQEVFQKISALVEKFKGIGKVF